ncbi:hypothetical protein QVD17_35249 [Tagetes erecta]|uniref:Uncharacterized protein n=1 Tax=Tagetes erecta TaxID=13708 RepID=A0AAD8NM76_TARER|nr:hypothetical protein QVD17_35249 [Tagetes erecta]
MEKSFAAFKSRLFVAVFDCFFFLRKNAAPLLRSSLRVISSHCVKQCLRAKSLTALFFVFATPLILAQTRRGSSNPALGTTGPLTPLFVLGSFTPKQNCAVCWALTAKLEFSGGRKGPKSAPFFFRCRKKIPSPRLPSTKSGVRGPVVPRAGLEDPRRVWARMSGNVLRLFPPPTGLGGLRIQR